MNKIIISGDMLRGTQNPNIRLFHSLLSPAIQAACPGIPIELCQAFDRDVFYHFFDLEYSEKNWVKIFYAEEIPQKAIDYLRERFAGCLVIMIEAPLVFLKIFDMLGIPCIDLTIHPIRYMDDLLLGFKANSQEIYQKLLKYQVNEFYFSFYAGLLKGTFQRRTSDKDDILPNSALFLGQTPVDRSLLNDKKVVVSVFDYQSELEQLGKDHSVVYFKPHPLVATDDAATEYMKSLDFVKIIAPDARNTYDLFACDQIKTVTALSSGTLYEAKYFGKKVKYFFKQPFHFAEEYDYLHSPQSLSINEIYVSIYRDYFSPHFWADVLAGFFPTVENAFKLPVEQLQNKLRYALNSRWGHKDVQSVFIDEVVLGIKEKRRTPFTQKLKKGLRKILPKAAFDVWHVLRYGSDKRDS